MRRGKSFPTSNCAPAEVDPLLWLSSKAHSCFPSSCANEALDFMTQIRESACARFTTVLGPGSDGYHEAHVHVDLKLRKGGYRICQWDLEQQPAGAAG
ncbi:MAG: extensin family protein [Rhodoblastus sp.]|uniref:extensin family protein n=1 Tax=Rhodoblastus sp. TaxID=1962975 RepID=UPI003F9E5A18